MSNPHFETSFAYKKQLAAAQKQPHELVSEDFVDWKKVDHSRREFISRGLEVPIQFQTAWNHHPAVLGSYRWETAEFPDRDLWLARMEAVDPRDIIPDPSNAYDTEWDEVAPGRRLADSISLAQSLGNLVTTVAYRDNHGRLMSKNDSFLIKALVELQVPAVFCWVIETDGSYAVNRTKYFRRARASKLSVPQQTLSEYNSGQFKLSAPLLCPTYTPEDLARVAGPTTGDKLGAIIKALSGDSDELRKVSQAEKRWIEKFTP